VKAEVGGDPPELAPHFFRMTMANFRGRVADEIKEVEDSEDDLL